MKRTVLATLLLALTFVGFGQEKSDNYYIDNRGRDALLAPRVGIGAGVFTFFGDVNDNNYQHIFTSTYGVEVRGSANLSRYFDLDLNVIYGNVTVNERTTSRNLNFKSEMFIGTAGISYNFNHLYKKPGIIQPFIGVGVSFINFDSKADMKDANGNLYVYDEEGGIFTAAGEATQRDYVYETDLRDENLDGLGKYDQYTFSIPVSAGVDFKMGKRLSAKLGAGFYYTFTDLIDDISEEGEGDRKGNSRNDMFLFTSLSVSYSIGVGKSYTKSMKTKYYEEVDFYAMQMADSDEDGVNDFDDKCAQTPAGAKVDEHGCPVDSDLDVIADYRDKEDSTKVDAVVDLEGVTLSDERMLAAYSDSLATIRANMHKVYPSGILSKRAPLTAEDSTKLAIMMLDIQNQVEKQGEFDQLFDEISKEVYSQTPQKAANVEDVYKSIDRVYKKMVDEKSLTPTRPLTITKEENISTTIPPEFLDADYNTDGLITADEVMRVIEDVLEGISPLSISQLYNLIDFYQEYMEGARAIDFGGTMAVYIDGTLNILENYRNDGLSDTQRFLVNKFSAADFNQDGKLTADEVNRMIAMFQKGESPYTEEQIYELIDLFFEE
ncbi:MAG: EF-hand domain-containing protein [Flavobacteriales bacterium]|nr:EF-hand domain-containing protein [Flavobacteriales bacterium]MCB9192029.1 EF-hand domain-containing protein [Flavobacteriales bacterium]MCB9204079.1 EF-hand domain-containing protein [Flavobacteriales bacterium]